MKSKKYILIMAFSVFLIAHSHCIAGWYDPAWSSRRLVIVDNTGNNQTLTDYQIGIIVPYFPDMQSDFDDIRFTDVDSTTSIPYWIEELFPSDFVIVWVKVPIIAALDTTILFMYYGNPSATSESEGEAVFDFFDDFNDQDISDWQIIAGSWTATNRFLEQLLLGNHQKALSSYWITIPSIVEARMNYLSDYHYSGNHLLISKDAGISSGYKFGYGGLNIGGTWIAKIVGGNPEPLVSNPAIWVGNYPYCWLRGKATFTGTSNLLFHLKAPDSIQVHLSAYDASYTLPFVLGNYVGAHTGIEDLRVRKYTDPEPGTSIGEEQIPEEIVIEPDHADSTNTGQTITYSIYAENRGLTKDVVEILKQWTQAKWQVTIRDSLTGDTIRDHNGNGIPDIDTLFPQEIRYLYVDITPDDSCYAGVTDTTTIKGYFASDTTISDTCVCITKIITTKISRFSKQP